MRTNFLKRFLFFGEFLLLSLTGFIMHSVAGISYVELSVFLGGILLLVGYDVFHSREE